MEFLHIHQSIRNVIFSTLDTTSKSVSLDAVQSHVMLSRDNKGRPRPLEKKEGLSKKELMTRTAHNNSQTIRARSLEYKVVMGYETILTS